MARAKKVKDEATSSELPDAFARAVDRLYSAPLAEFVRMRRDLAVELRASGDAAAARRIADVSKPTRATWAINRVARTDARLVGAMLDARRAAEEAQAQGGADRIREALGAYRAKTNNVVLAARDALREAGIEASAAELRKIADALRTASADEGFVRKRLVSGRLERSASDDDNLVAALEQGAATKREKRAPRVDARQEKERQREQARRAAQAQALARDRAKAIARAKSAVDALERTAKKARDAATRAEARADEARATLQRLREEEDR